MLLVASALNGGFSGDLLAEPPPASTGPILRIATVPSDTVPANRSAGSEPAELQLQAPTNSTLEIRVARRPWLLQKLIKPKTEPSVKMDPPRPPADLRDPPSMSRMIPKDDGWFNRRRGAPSYADVQPDEARQTQQRDVPGPDASRSVKNRLRPDATGPVSPAEDTLDNSKPETSTGDSNASDPAKAEPDIAEPNIAEPNDSESTDSEPHGSESIDSESTDSEPTDSESTDSESESPAAAVAVEETVDRSETAEVMDRSETQDQNTESNPDRSAIETPEPGGRVRVRELQIDLDGMPLRQSAPRSRGSVGESNSVESGTIAPKSVELDPPELDPPELDPVATVELDYAGYPREPIRLTSTVKRMQNSIRHCLRYYYGRPEVANERSNWGMLHSIMVYGIDTKVVVGNRSYSAIAWIAGNNACRGRKLLTEQNGMISATSGVGLQGHQAQMLAVFSLCDVPADYPLYAGNQQYSLNDIIDAEMLACRSDAELTFTLIGLAHYLDTNLGWRNDEGEAWDFERLIREELAQTIVGAACGGTHRLMGFAHAMRKRRAEGRPMTGQWKRAELFTQDFVKYAYRLQNRDGSMSTDWFEGREDNGDLDRKIQTTGHVVEWLLTVTPDSQLQNPRLVSAIRFLLNSMYSERDHEWKIGPKGHALRSLAMYYERVYQSGSAWQSRAVADSQRSPRR